VHGGMGFTEEYDLQLYTRRLHEWRIAYGSEAFWNRELGTELLQKSDTRAIDFIREAVMA
jgi:alkylation response protein AidB-like acyl-CoA dehydrogenase